MDSYSPPTGSEDLSRLQPDGAFLQAGHSSISDILQPGTSHSQPHNSGYSSPIATPSAWPQTFDSVEPPTSKLTRIGPEKRIPRPRNAFMIFRSAFWAEQKISRTVERDHRHISRIIGHCWNRMSEQEKDKWRAKAQQEKDEHSRKHPGYVFSPAPKNKKPMRRKVKRNGPEDIKRCEAVADLLLMGKQGEELAEAIRAIKIPGAFEGEDPPISPSANTSSSSTEYWSGSDLSYSDLEDPPFRSPLLPPSSLHSTPLATPSFLSPEPSPLIGAFSGAQNPRTSYNAPTPPPELPHVMIVDQTSVAQYLESTLLQTPAALSLATSNYKLESSTEHFPPPANPGDTPGPTGHHAAHPSTLVANLYSPSARYPPLDATAVPPMPANGTGHDFSMIPPRSPSPEPDYYTASTRLPGVDGSIIECLPVPESPARVVSEPVYFKDPFRSNP